MRSATLVAAGAILLTACNGGADLIAPDLTFPPSVDPRSKDSGPGLSHGPTSPAAPGPEFTFTRGPSHPSQWIERSSGLPIYGFVAGDLTVIVGLATPLPEACAAGEGEVAFVDEQFVTPPSGRFHVLDLGQELPLVVYAARFTSDLCGMPDAPVLASGTGHLSATISYAPDGSGTLSQRTQGEVTYLSGGGAGRVSAFGDVSFGSGGTVTNVHGGITITGPR